MWDADLVPKYYHSGPAYIGVPAEMEVLRDVAYHPSGDEGAG